MSKAYHAKESSGAPAAVLIVVGVLLVLLGGYASTHGELGLASTFEALGKQGIPILLGKTISTIGVFLILFPVIKFFFLTPLGDAVDERNSNLEQTFSEAESLRAEMTTMRNDYETRLTAAEASAREHIEAQIKEAQNLRQTLMDEAANRADAHDRAGPAGDRLREGARPERTPHPGRRPLAQSRRAHHRREHGHRAQP